MASRPALLSRRMVLATGAAALAAPGLPRRLSAQDVPSLADLARARGLLLGTALPPNYSTAYGRLVNRHAALVTPEWGMKPHDMAPSATRRIWRDADKVAQFARRTGKHLHGHTLFWHANDIAWPQSTDFTQTTQAYGRFLTDVVGRYGGALSWDVFNEIVDSDNRGLRQHPILSAHGVEFIAFCLRHVRALAPQAELVINDYGTECAQKWCQRRGMSLFALLKQVTKTGAPLDALGIQGHLSSRQKSAPKRAVGMIRKAARLGLRGHVSELDVNDQTFPADIAKRDERVAEYYYDFLMAVLKQRSLSRVVFWGLADDWSWITKGYAPDRRASGSGAPRPLLFDADGRAKPAYWAVKSALESA